MGGLGSYQAKLALSLLRARLFKEGPSMQEAYIAPPPHSTPGIRESRTPAAQLAPRQVGGVSREMQTPGISDLLSNVSKQGNVANTEDPQLAPHRGLGLNMFKCSSGPACPILGGRGKGRNASYLVRRACSLQEQGGQVAPARGSSPGKKKKKKTTQKTKTKTDKQTKTRKNPT